MCPVRTGERSSRRRPGSKVENADWAPAAVYPERSRRAGATSHAIRDDESWGTSLRFEQHRELNLTPFLGFTRRLVDDLVVVGVRADPKPGDAVVHVNAKSTIMQPDTHGRILADS